jgi:phage/plasmid-like protein (TIGR03299 family)
MAALIETMLSANAIVPWHRQGVVLDGYPTIDEAVVNSGLTWNVQKYPLRAVVSKDDGDSEVTVDIPQFALMRDTDLRFYGTCSDDYKVYQNSEAFEWCRPLVESEEWKLETAGSLKQGQTCWILLNQGTVSVLPKDNLKQYLLLTWSHDGKTAVRLGLTSVRVVCNNTLTQALNMEGNLLHKFAHNSALNYRLMDVQALYSDTAAAFAKQIESFGALADVELKKADKEDFIESIVQEAHRVTPEEDLEDMTERRKKSIERTRQEINWFVDNGLGQQDLKLQNNLWGVFNAVEAWSEKARSGRRIQDRGYDILFGRGKQLVDFAYNHAAALAGI